MARLFLGLDSSTQSLSAIVINYDARRIVYENSLSFDKMLPHYGTRNGTLRSSDPLVVHSPPLMWVAALDILFGQMKNDGVALGEIIAVSGSGQQHGSVYLNDRAAGALGKLKLAELVKHIKNLNPAAPVSAHGLDVVAVRPRLAGLIERTRP